MEEATTNEEEPTTKNDSAPTRHSRRPYWPDEAAVPIDPSPGRAAGRRSFRPTEAAGRRSFRPAEAALPIDDFPDQRARNNNPMRGARTMQDAHLFPFTDLDGAIQALSRGAS